MAYATINPYTGKTLSTYPEASDAEINSAIDKAHEAFLAWRETSFTKRAEILQKAANILRANAEDYAKILTLEMGKLLSEAKSEVEISAKIMEYYVHNTEKLLAPESLSPDNKQVQNSQIVHEPLGIILAVEPWNFPYYQVARILAPQISAGNTVLLKHASNVPQSAAAFEKLMLEAGLPEGVFQNLYPTRSQIETIINDPRVSGVALTGSEGAGAVVASQAGKALKKSTLELGGSDAFVVLADADIDKAVKMAVAGRHFNAGQVCVAAKRMIIVDELYDKFVELYRDAVSKLVAGDPMDPQTSLAPLSSQEAADKVKQQVEEAVKNGAKAEKIGSTVPQNGAFVQPTFLTEVKQENPAYYQEFFGPISMLFRAKDEDEAIKIANDTPFGLGGSIFTQDIAKGQKLARKIDTGMVYINSQTGVEADLPFGGIKRSGYGRELIGLGIKEFVNHKLVAVIDSE